MKFNATAFSLSCGILWGAAMLLGTWWVILFDGTSTEATIISTIYRGHSVTMLGSFIGMAWGFVDGLIGGFLFAWMYNWIAAHVEGLHLVHRTGMGPAAPAH